MFPNLIALLEQRNISIPVFAKILSVNEKTARNKLNGITEFTLSEIQIVIELFPEYNMSYVFKRKSA